MSITLNPSTAAATAVSVSQPLPVVRLGRHAAGLPGLRPLAHARNTATSGGRHHDGTVTVAELSAQLTAEWSLRPLADQLTAGLVGGQS
jgi:hypothetical protein